MPIIHVNINQVFSENIVKFLYLWGKCKNFLWIISFFPAASLFDRTEHNAKKFFLIDLCVTCEYFVTSIWKFSISLFPHLWFKKENHMHWTETETGKKYWIYRTGARNIGSCEHNGKICRNLHAKRKKMTFHFRTLGISDPTIVEAKHEK